MQPVEFLSHVEPSVQALFAAMRNADSMRKSAVRFLEPAYRAQKFEAERWSLVSSTNENHVAQLQVANSLTAIVLADTAAAASAGAILQIAKQCIVMAWLPEARLTKGRKVGSQSLSAVIVYSRNQAQHFEEGPKRNDKTEECIQKLSQEMGLDISTLLATPRSLARDIVRILNWESYEMFASDLFRLFQEP